MAIKSVVASAVLGLLFLSLLAIYLLLPSNGLVMFLAVLIMLVSLIVAQGQRWRDIGIMAVFAALVSVVAAALTGRALFGGLGGVLLPIVWALVLLGLFSWAQRNMIVVPKDRAILIVNRYTGAAYTAVGPIAPPLTPGVEMKLAVIPLYELSQDVRVEKVNTKRFNVDTIQVHIHYRVTDPKLAYTGIPNRGQVQGDIAKGMNLEINKARQDVRFWEKLLGNQMELEVEDIVREVVYNNVFAQNPLEVYQRREDLGAEVKDRLSKLVSRWGVDIKDLEFERVDVDYAILQRLNKANVRLDNIEQKKSEAEGEAAWIERTGAAQAKAEAMRVAEMVQALKESGVELSANDLRDIVIDAIRASTEWGMEGELARFAAPSATSGNKR
jgi:regulator of protease activity HflC (stomatin/prohibitin superfamily)